MSLSLDERLAAAAARRHRVLVVLAGERDAGLELAGRLLAASGDGETLTLSDHPAAPPPALRAPTPAQLVGRELDAALIDAHAGFDADACGALAGTVRGGGLLVLCCPPLQRWADHDDPYRSRLAVFGLGESAVGRRYLARLARRLASSDDAIVIDPAATRPPSARGARGAPPAPVSNPDQRRAVDAVRHVVSGQRRRPAVLTADRGRGKSAALGLAAAALLRDGARRVVVCAASRSAVTILFRHAREALGDAAGSGTAVRRGHAVIEYLEPGRLLATEPSAVDLVLVDEAAALPLHWLEQALRRFPRIAFATTVHGYEGSGRGFATRFQELLARHTRGWRQVELAEPVRYAADDPLERLMFDALMLDAEPAALAPDPGDLPPDIETLHRDRLAGDETCLRQFFGLLVAAHYRTRPNDLRYLLDGPNLRLVAAFEGDAVVGAAVVAREGGFEPQTARRVHDGLARPRGHMLAETVCAQLGEPGWLAFEGLRVVRIAVHPERRRRGIGKRLLEHVASLAAADGCHYVGSSFAVAPDIAHFWLAAGYRPLWLSAKTNATSGARSLVVVKTLDETAGRLACRARRRFLDGFRVRLAGLYADEDPANVELLFHGCPEPRALEEADLADVARFAAGRAHFEAAFTGLWRAVPLILAEPGIAGRLSARERALAIRVVLQQHDASRVGDELGMDGRRAVLEGLAGAFDRVARALATAVVTGR